jgi:hypothetical protein
VRENSLGWAILKCAIQPVLRSPNRAVLKRLKTGFWSCLGIKFFQFFSSVDSLAGEIHEHQYEILNLNEAIQEELSIHFDQYVEFAYLNALTHPFNREFKLIDPADYQRDILVCKGFFKKTWDYFEKGCKKAYEFGKKTVKEVGDFVKEHKKEVLIGAAVVAVAVGAYFVAGALAAGAEATEGSKKREDEDDRIEPPVSSSPPSDPPTSAQQNPVLQLFEELRQNRLDLVAKEEFDLTYRPHEQDSTSHEEDHLDVPAPSTSHDDSHTQQNPVLRLFEELRQSKPESVVESQFDLTYRPQEHDSTPVTQNEQAHNSGISSSSIANAFSKYLEALHVQAVEPSSQPAPFIPGLQSMPFERSKSLEHFPKRLESLLSLVESKTSFGSSSEILPNASAHPSEIKMIWQSAFANYLDAVYRQAIDPSDQFNSFNLEPIASTPSFKYNPEFLIEFPKTLLARYSQLVHSKQENRALSSLREKSISLLKEVVPDTVTTCRFETEGIIYDNMQGGFVNGMNTSFEEFKSHLYHLKKFVGDMSIEGVYNHTNGFIDDLAEIWLLNYEGFAPIKADMLIDNWKRFHEKNQNNPNAKYLQFTHSMGNILTRNALLNAPKEIRDRVIVIAIAPAAIIPDGLCYKSFHYASEKDYIHLGENFFTLFVIGAIEESLQVEALELLIETKKHLTILEPHEGAEGWDHDFESPTFDKKIKEQLENYIQNNGQFE